MADIKLNIDSQQDTVKQDHVETKVDNDVKKDQVLNTDVKQDEKKDIGDNNPDNNQDKKLNVAMDENLQAIKDFYDKKLKDLQKANSSLDKKISDQKKILNEYERKEMTEEQKRELEKKERKTEYHQLYVEKAIAKFNLNKDDEDVDFKRFLYSNEEDPDLMQEEIMENGRMLRDYIDKVIKAGIERGVNEQLAKGSYIPRSSANINNPDDFENMTREDIAKKMNDIIKMPPSPEKDKLLQKAMMEQARRVSKV